MKRLLLLFVGAGMACGSAWAAVVTGEGTAANPYVIATAADWNAVADDMTKQYEAGADTLYSGAVFKLTADLDFTGTAMKPWALNVPFDGVVDGGNFTLKGYTLKAGKIPYYAPIGWMGPKSEVRNLTVAGTVESDTTYVGGLVGSCEGTLRNVTHAGTIKANFAGRRVENKTTYGSVGGLVGMAIAFSSYYHCVNTGLVEAHAGMTGGIIGEGSYGLTVDGCENKGTIRIPIEWAAPMFGDYVAGICGYSFTSWFTNCTNSGTIYTPNCRYVAGILGYGKVDKESFNAVAPNVRFVFKNCVNYSDLDCYQGLSGIFARTGSQANYNRVYVENCHNHGNLSLNYSKSSTNAGAQIAGISYGLSWGSEYYNCTNTGNITAKNTNYIGGVFGTCTSAPSKEIDATANMSNVTTIRNCHNYGDITVTTVEGNTSAASYVGGVLSSTVTYMSVDSCSNSGKITANGSSVAGVLAYMKGAVLVETTIKNCWNTGDITGGCGNIGGVFGNIDSSNRRIIVENCWNGGNVATTGELGGIYPSWDNVGINVGGVAGLQNGLMQNCYNVGNVKGVGRVGGVVGAPTKTYSTIFNCYNAGKVDALPDSCGSIVGVHLDYTGNWVDGNAIINSYYVTDYGKYANDEKYGAEAGTPVTVAQLCKTNVSDAYVAGGENCMPVLKNMSKEQSAQLYSAAVVPADGDSYSKITKDFSVGTPDGTVWSASNQAVAFNGNEARLTDYINEDVVLTAKLGDFSKDVTVHITGGTSGIDSVEGDTAAEVVAESWYGLDGRAVVKPAGVDGAAYVVVQKLADGSTRTVKVINQ